MLKLQTTPLPPDVMYVLDGALDNNDINPFTHIVLSLYGDRRVITELVDRVPEPEVRGWAQKTGKMCLELDKIAHDTANYLPEQQQRTFVASSLVREPARLMSLAEVYAEWNYTDSTVGGALKKFKKQPRINTRGQPTGQVRHRLRDDTSIRRYVNTVDDESGTHACKLADRLRARPWPECLSESETLDRYFREQTVRYREENTRRIEAFRTRVFTSSSALRAARQRDRQRRKMLIRSVRASQAVLGRSAVSALLAGESVLLEGHLINFRISVDRRLSAIGHGGITIALEDRHARLCNLCLFFEGTPALEQAAAVALHVQVGDELDLLDTGNPYNVTPAGAVNPYIMERISRNHEAAVDLERVRRAIPDPVRTRTSDYVRESAPRYFEALIDRVWGSHAAQLRTLVSSMMGIA